ncbi:catalase [Paenibacillus sp. HB172176]|uniref:catalase n=1 Tax=Paenibacillus sp. HB172176 TaxID=2493690 RepID=UPI00143A6359|nr:catalase [Paenibacillus sp. HB172176]
MEHSKLTTNGGAPLGDNRNSRTAGGDGPALLEDDHLLEKIARNGRERKPESVAQERGAGARGIFVTENSMSQYTKASFLQEAGEETPVFVRFSTVIHGTGLPETARDSRGFAVKFYTKEGNYDLVGNHLPVFFIRDAMKLPDMVQALKRAPDTNLQDPARYWDFMTLSPESTHMLTWLFSDDGTPASYREMDGFSVHAFKWINAAGEQVYVKYNWKSQQGVRNFTAAEAARMQAADFNHATRDLYGAIENGEFPRWELHVQVMPVDHLGRQAFDPLDPTKLWPEDRYPLQKIGTMTLNRNPVNYFGEVEQSAFAPSVVVTGIEPFEEPNNGGGMPQQSPQYRDASSAIHGYIGSQRIGKMDDFTQAGERFRSLSGEGQTNLISNLIGELERTNDEIRLRAICNFFRADRMLGMQLSQGLGVDIRSYMPQS